MTAVYHFGPRTTLHEIAECSAGARRVLERAGLDYCCDGESTLAEACADLHLPVDPTLEALERAYRVARDPPVHGRTRRSLPSLLLLAERMHERTRELIYSVADALEVIERSPNRGAAADIAAAFRLVRKEAFALMSSERRDLFLRLEALGAARSPRSPVGDLRARLQLAHERYAAIGASLRGLRRAIALSRGEPALRSLREQLRTLDRHLVRQLDLESHPLFRRALEHIVVHETA